VGVLVLLAIPTDLAMRTRPRLAYFAKLRTSTTVRCVDLVSGLMDWDRDGFAPGFLVGGWDPAPFDPSRPAPILERSGGAHAAAAPGGARGAEPARPGAGAAPAPSPAAPPATTPAAPHILLLPLDACRADVVAPTPATASPLGALRPPTPVLDSLAGRSAVFD